MPWLLRQIMSQNFFSFIKKLKAGHIKSALVKPYRIYIGNRTKGSFYKKIQYWDNFLARKQCELSGENLRKFLASMNSYLGIMRQYSTYKLRKKMLIQNLSAYFWNYAYISNNYSKLVLKIKKDEKI